MIPPLPPTFDAALRDVGAQSRRFRLAAAARLGEPPTSRRGEAVAGLLRLGRDADGGVRAAAFESLGVLEAVEGAALLHDAFDDDSPEARQAAVLALGRVAPERADVISRLLADPRPEMRFSAVWTLSSFGPQSANAIARALGDADSEIRALAAQCLADLDARNHAERIAALLDDELDAVRFTAAASLATLGDHRGAPILRDSLAHPDRALVAAIGLGDLRDRDSLADLTRLANHRWRSPILRAAAARALVRLGDPEGQRIIGKLVRSWRIEARQYAVQLVGELGLTSLLPDVVRAFRRSRKLERHIYETTLEQLAPANAEAAALLASIRRADHPA